MAGAFTDKLKHDKKAKNNKAFNAAMLHSPDELEQMKKQALAVVEIYRKKVRKKNKES